MDLSSLTALEIPVHVLGTVLVLAIVLIIRTLLDLEMGVWVVRMLHWVPTRWLFRQKYVSLNGEWEHIWGGQVGRFALEKDRHGHHYMYQLFRWVYAGTRSQGAVFAAFGRIQGEYLIGRWYDKNDPNGYFGAFQLRIVSSAELDGTWTGHSKKNPALIQTGAWKWTKNPR